MYSVGSSGVMWMGYNTVVRMCNGISWVVIDYGDWWARKTCDMTDVPTLQPTCVLSLKYMAQHWPQIPSHKHEAISSFMSQQKPSR